MTVARAWLAVVATLAVFVGGCRGCGRTPGVVARLADVQGFLGTMPQGLDTPVHERGQTLSAGER